MGQNDSTAHAIPDALSRAPVVQATAEDMTEFTAGIDLEIALIAKRAICSMDESDQHYNEEQSSSKVVDIFMDKIRNACSDDEEIKCLKSTITEGKEYQLSKPFKGILNQLTVQDGLVLFESRIVVPLALRRVCWPAYTTLTRALPER
jgi:hypothetical protein